MISSRFWMEPDVFPGCLARHGRRECKVLGETTGKDERGGVLATCRVRYTDDNSTAVVNSNKLKRVSPDGTWSVEGCGLGPGSRAATYIENPAGKGWVPCFVVAVTTKTDFAGERLLVQLDTGKRITVPGWKCTDLRGADGTPPPQRPAKWRKLWNGLGEAPRPAAKPAAKAKAKAKPRAKAKARPKGKPKTKAKRPKR